MELQKINLETSSKDSSVAAKPIVSTSKPVINSMSKDSFFTPIKIVSFVIVLIIGLGSGYLLKNKGGGISGRRNSGPVIARNVPEAGIKEGDIIGIQDTTSFKDSSTGVLQKGGLDGEGSHNLLRPGGSSQTVYLTSSVVDLDAFVGNQVTVWGETFKGQKVGWLMDVGRVKVEKLNAPNPQ
jgi:hypothetical protein